MQDAGIFIFFSSKYNYSSDRFENSKDQTIDCNRWSGLEYIGSHGISLSGSYQQGYSTAYNTQSHIKVVCNGYILIHILNWNTQGHLETLPSKGGSLPWVIRGTRPICMLVNAWGLESPLSGTDSDLEAFSRYPADGSFAAMPGRAAAKTNYLNQRFLSY